MTQYRILHNREFPGSSRHGLEQVKQIFAACPAKHGDTVCIIQCRESSTDTWRPYIAPKPDIAVPYGILKRLVDTAVDYSCQVADNDAVWDAIRWAQRELEKHK